jgi:hypothetical protein
VVPKEELEEAGKTFEVVVLRAEGVGLHEAAEEEEILVVVVVAPLKARAVAAEAMTAAPEVEVEDLQVVAQLRAYSKKTFLLSFLLA